MSLFAGQQIFFVVGVFCAMAHWALGNVLLWLAVMGVLYRRGVRLSV